MKKKKCFDTSAGNNIVSTKNPTEVFAYGSVKFVTMALPFIWLDVSSDKIKLLFFNCFYHKFLAKS